VFDIQLITRATPVGFQGFWRLCLREQAAREYSRLMIRLGLWLLVLLVGGCAYPLGVGSSVTAPAFPQTGSAVQESVQAYLRTFKLNEKDLVPGLTIPFAQRDSGAPPYTCGAARVTGKLGPHGHEIYELVIAGDWTLPRFMEIAPE
jgi:hypothetical protein